MARLTIEEKNKAYKEFIIRFLSKPNVFDYEKYAKLQDAPSIKKVDEALAFIKENMSEDVYEEFAEKVLPLEANKKHTQEEVEEKRKEIAELAKQVNLGKAGLIEIVDAAGSLPRYALMVKQLRFKYGTIGASIFSSNTAYVDNNSLYDNPNIVLTTKHINITKEEEEKIYDIIRSRGLYLNNYTYKEAHKYAVNKGIVKPTKMTR
ncbi:MAG: hypothetical protein IKJ30_03275 [Bacilli bacterium]|nr:hypothetical protein [Bacilli bacterium]